MTDVVMYRNLDCGTSRNMLALIRDAKPAGKSTAVADKPFWTIKATAMGINTPRSATAPASFARSNRNRPE